MKRCPELETLAALLDESLDPEERQLVEAHLVECEPCRKAVSLALKSEDAVRSPRDSDERSNND